MNSQIQAYKESLLSYAEETGMSLRQAFDTCCTPCWVWSECAKAADAAGPLPVADVTDILEAFMIDTAERESASSDRYERIRAMVCGDPASKAGADWR